MVTPDEYERLHRAFAAVCDLDPAEREATMRELCRGDHRMLAEVETLLAEDERPEGFLDKAIVGSRGPGGAWTPTAAEQTLVGQRIGHYSLKRVIAAGGMGMVYEAVQLKPRRTVALKVMRAGLASPSTLRRFEYESQILARLRHPGIAQVFEADIWQVGDGRVPYFVMEYVPGARSITDFAAQAGLNVRRRLELFTQVCAAVHHGHQKGVIHRDLKPDNILVDASGQPKIIDFGVARATDSDMAVTTLQTEVGQLVGTLQYMSPEQCEADPHDLDSRSDVYALGVILYELLCGELPYDVSAVPVVEAARVVREETPRRPSTTDRTVRGDLETIVLKAIEKDRTRRYQSASELAADIDRYLHALPIVARPPSAIYQLRKFARRNKLLVGATITLMVALIAATVVSTRFAIAAGRQQDNAEAVVRFLNDEVLAVPRASADPGRDRNMLMRDAVRRAGERINTGQVKLPPLAEAEIRVTIAGTLGPLGERAAAQQHVERAFEIRREILGAGHPETIQVQRSIGNFYWVRGLGRQAVEHDRATLRVAQRELGDDHRQTIWCMQSLAGHLRGLRKLDEAQAWYERALDASRRTLGDEDDVTLRFTYNLGNLYFSRQDYVEAEKLYAQALEARERSFPDNHFDLAALRHAVGVACLRQGRYDKAEPLFEQALPWLAEVRGDTDPYTRLTLQHLAEVYRETGRPDAARPLTIRLIDACKEVATHAEATAAQKNDCAWLLLTCEPTELRDPAVARAIALESNEMTGFSDANFLGTLSLAYHLTGDTDRAIENQREAIALLPPEPSSLRAELEGSLTEFEAARNGD